MIFAIKLSVVIALIVIGLGCIAGLIKTIMKMGSAR